MARRKRRHSNTGTVEIPMGPMIDMVFLLLVFFMVSAKPVKPEADLGMGLPGAVAQSEPVDLPEELLVALDAGGRVLVNEGEVPVPELANLFRRFQESAKNSRSKAMVALNPHDRCPHQRLVDVLDACAEAGLSGVTFVDSGEEDL